MKIGGPVDFENENASFYKEIASILHDSHITTSHTNTICHKQKHLSDVKLGFGQQNLVNDSRLLQQLNGFKCNFSKQSSESILVSVNELKSSLIKQRTKDSELKYFYKDSEGPAVPCRINSKLNDEEEVSI